MRMHVCINWHICEKVQEVLCTLASAFRLKYSQFKYQLFTLLLAEKPYVQFQYACFFFQKTVRSRNLRDSLLSGAPFKIDLTKIGNTSRDVRSLYLTGNL